MEYINNQYLRLDKSIDDISKIKIKIDENNKLIECLEIIDGNPNIIIACGEDVEYNNIFGTVRILITDEKAINRCKNKNGSIPKYIEKIIVYGCVYENKKKEIDKIKASLDMLKIQIILNNLIINNNNINKTFLIEQKEAYKHIKTLKINFNQVDENGCNIFMLLCENPIISVDFLMELLEEHPEIDINFKDKNNENALRKLINRGCKSDEIIIKICKKML